MNNRRKKSLKKIDYKTTDCIFVNISVLNDFSFATSVSPTSRVENGFRDRWVFCLCIFVCGIYILRV